LEDQRIFLLGSLEDLDRERAAGDLTEDDFQLLRDDYTSRLAAVLHRLDARSSEVREHDAGRSRGRNRLVVVAAIAFLLVAGVSIRAAVSRREPGQTLTGNTPASRRSPVAEAAALARAGDLDGAVARYDEVLAADPDNVEALTYRGWLTYLGGDPTGLMSLIDAAQLKPDYPDVHAFLALIFARLGRTDTALAELDRLEALDPSPRIAALAANLRAEISTAEPPAPRGG
ncbi:MAG: tetratricopeptide repeat protein, partial [Acidimicrobiales bacterium]